jgi:hypothetical protein
VLRALLLAEPALAAEPPSSPPLFRGGVGVTKTQRYGRTVYPRALPSGLANRLEPAEQFLWCDGPVSRPPTLEQKVGQRRSMLLARSPLQAPAGRERLVHGLASPHDGKGVPGSGAAARAQRILGVSDLAQKPVDLLLTAERAVRMTLRARARTVEHVWTG